MLQLHPFEQQSAINTLSIEALIRRAAFDLLAMREHSQHELVNKLIRKFKKCVDLAVSEQNIIDVVSTINSEGLQSDKRYFEMLVRSRINQGHGPIRIAQELKQKGIEQHVFDGFLNSRDDQWLILAKHVKQKKFGNGRAVNQKEQGKQIRFMQYRGFTSEQIRFAMS